MPYSTIYGGSICLVSIFAIQKASSGNILSFQAVFSVFQPLARLICRLTYAPTVRCHPLAYASTVGLS